MHSTWLRARLKARGWGVGGVMFPVASTSAEQGLWSPTADRPWCSSLVGRQARDMSRPGRLEEVETPGAGGQIGAECPWSSHGTSMCHDVLICEMGP